MKVIYEKILTQNNAMARKIFYERIQNKIWEIGEQSNFKRITVERAKEMYNFGETRNI